MNCVRVDQRILGLTLDTYQLKDLEYADDVTILAPSLEQLLRDLQICQEEASKLGLEISWRKTKVMAISDPNAPSTVQVNGIDVNVISAFDYLGSTVTMSGSCELDISKRIGKAANVMKSLHTQLWTQRTVSRTTKLRIYKAAILPVLLYGSETWTWTSTLARRLNAFDTRALRRLENIRWSDFVSNAELRQRTNTVPLTRTIRKHRLSCLSIAGYSCQEYLRLQPPRRRVAALPRTPTATLGGRCQRGSRESRSETDRCPKTGCRSPYMATTGVSCSLHAI